MKQTRSGKDCTMVKLRVIMFDLIKMKGNQVRLVYGAASWVACKQEPPIFVLDCEDFACEKIHQLREMAETRKWSVPFECVLDFPPAETTRKLTLTERLRIAPDKNTFFSVLDQIVSAKGHCGPDRKIMLSFTTTDPDENEALDTLLERGRKVVKKKTELFH